MLTANNNDHERVIKITNALVENIFEKGNIYLDRLDYTYITRLTVQLELACVTGNWFRFKSANQLNDYSQLAIVVYETVHPYVVAKDRVVLETFVKEFISRVERYAINVRKSSDVVFRKNKSATLMRTRTLLLDHSAMEFVRIEISDNFAVDKINDPNNVVINHKYLTVTKDEFQSHASFKEAYLVAYKARVDLTLARYQLFEKDSVTLPQPEREVLDCYVDSVIKRDIAAGRYDPILDTHLNVQYFALATSLANWEYLEGKTLELCREYTNQWCQSNSKS